MIRRPPRSTLFPTRRSSDLARGAARSLRWSPDGSKLAFVSDRGDHAFVAVYDVATKTLRFLDPSVDSDADPDRKSTRLNSSHLVISYAVFCLKKKKKSYTTV